MSLEDGWSTFPQGVEESGVCEFCRQIVPAGATANIRDDGAVAHGRCLDEERDKAEVVAQDQADEA